MSTLVLVLATAMAVPGSGPEMVSDEVEQGLDLSGEWEGRWQISEGGGKHIDLSNGMLSFWDFSLPSRFQIQNQTGNRLCIQWSGRPYLGIYKRCDDRILICLRVAEDGPPTSFGFGEDRVILTLRRVKPQK